MAEYDVRFVAENGNDTTGDGTADNPFRLPSKAITDLGTAGGLHTTGVVMIGGGTYTETSTIQLTRGIQMIGAGPWREFVGGTRILRGHAGHLIEWDAGFNDWSHEYTIASLTLDGDKDVQTADADLLRIKRPGFNCQLKNVNFRDSSGVGLHISQGANNLHTYDLSFLGNKLGAIEMVSTTAGGGFGIWAAFWGSQIDGNVGDSVDGVYIQQDKTSRSHILFDFPEFEQGFSNAINADLTSSADNVQIVVSGLVAQGTTTLFRESGTKPAHWLIAGASGGSDLFQGVNETVTATGGCGFRTFGNMLNGIGDGVNSRIGCGENTWFSGTGTPEGTQVGFIGDLYSRRDGGSGTSLYVKESGNNTNTGWSSVS
jgi:hypothetical protein